MSPSFTSSDKAQFIRKVTHDINGNFQGVASLCLMLKHVIQKDQDPDPILDHLTDAFKEYNSRLSNFLQYTRADAGIVDSFPEQVNVRRVLSRLREEPDSLASEKQIGIELL